MTNLFQGTFWFEKKKVDASIHWRGCVLQLFKRLHLLWNFSERLNDWDDDLIMKELP